MRWRRLHNWGSISGFGQRMRAQKIHVCVVPEKSLALSYLAFVQNFQKREAFGPSSQRHSRKSRQIRGKTHPGECICNRQEPGTVLEESNIPLLFQAFQIKHCYPGQGASSFCTSEAAPATPQKAALRLFDEHSFL